MTSEIVDTYDRAVQAVCIRLADGKVVTLTLTVFGSLMTSDIALDVLVGGKVVIPACKWVSASTHGTSSNARVVVVDKKSWLFYDKTMTMDTIEKDGGMSYELPPITTYWALNRLKFSKEPDAVVFQGNCLTFNPLSTIDVSVSRLIYTAPATGVSITGPVTCQIMYKWAAAGIDEAGNAVKIPFDALPVVTFRVAADK
jgi:hypothetical protein